MKEVSLAIAKYNLELSRAIQFRREHPLEEDEVSESESVTMDQEIGETPFFPADPRAGAKVKKFVTSDGWYNGLIKFYFPETDTINVDLENGTEGHSINTKLTHLTLLLK